MLLQFHRNAGGTGSARSPMTYSMFLDTHKLLKVCAWMTVLAIVIALARPGLMAKFFGRVEKCFGALARKPRYAIAAAALFPMLARLAILPWYPPPNPIVHDEFSYLLQADTFAHGRVVNPTPPNWKHFETEYTLLRPAYASQYQPGQGLTLAAGQLIFGHPWWGVWMDVGLMCGAICWALGFILPRHWALFGALVASLQFGIFGIWMNSYFGGAVSATAGALVFGSLASLNTGRYALQNRILWERRAMICGLGIMLLFATRPVEGVIATVVAIVYTWSRLRKMNLPTGIVLRRIAFPFTAVFVCGAAMLAWYNWRVTGNPAVPPYLAYRNIYGTPQPYWWQAPFTISHFDFPEIRDNYLNQLRLYRERYSLAAMVSAERDRLENFWRFFVGPFLTPALIFLAVVFRDRRMRPWLLISIPFIAEKVAYHAWFPAHSGPVTLLVVLILAQCWRHLRVWRRTQRTGVAVSRVVMAAFCAAIFLGAAGRAAEPILPRLFRHLPPIWESLYPPRRLRDDVTAVLARIPGQHLLFVKYAPGHCFCEEWVSNGAQLDEQKIVYVRPRDPASDEALMQAFPAFDVWEVEPDQHPYRLWRVEPSAASASYAQSEPRPQ